MIIQIIDEASNQRKGTVTVITGIDGALLIDSQGYCHAIGCILDGYVDIMSSSVNSLYYK